MSKNKQYTRKQIQEAIAYWTKQLHLIDEAHNALIDALEKEFGHDIVFTWVQDYTLSQEDYEKIFGILNTYLFNGQLKPIGIFWWPEDKIVERLNYNAIASGEHNKLRTSAPCYGVFSGVCKDVLDNNGDIIDIDISNEAILMNKSKLTQCAFIFAVACICHEMIHYYDRFTKEFYNKQLENSRSGKVFDSHKDKAFQEKMKEANANGIHVVEDFGQVNTYNNINRASRYKLYSVVGESEKYRYEDDDVINSFDGHTWHVKNKKTGIGSFAFLD